MPRRPPLPYDPLHLTVSLRSMTNRCLIFLEVQLVYHHLVSAQHRLRTLSARPVGCMYHSLNWIFELDESARLVYRDRVYQVVSEFLR